MDYTKFTVEEFASHESFISWVNKSDPEAVRFWDFYIASHPEIQSTVEKARALVVNLKLAEQTRRDAARVEAMWTRIHNRVELQGETPARAPAGKVNSLALAFLALLCICAAAWVVFQYGNGVTRSADYDVYRKRLPDFVEQVNETGRPLEIQLADGSTVVLEPKSRVKYKADYLEDSTRAIYLLGEASFDVTEDPYKPFIVHSNEVLVKVLGTKFRVSAPENGENIVVSVKTGKVSVYAVDDHAGGRDKKNAVILLPNQQVSYERKEQLFEKTLVDAPEVLNKAMAQSDLVFDNTPIAEVFSTIETAYGVEIIFNEEIMKNCFITAPLGAEPMMEKLKIICQTIGATFEIIDARVVVTSTGCQ